MEKLNRQTPRDLVPRAHGVPRWLSVGHATRRTNIGDGSSALARNARIPDWDHVPFDEGNPFEPKASNWGRLLNGRLVALDYALPAGEDSAEIDAIIGGGDL